MHLRIISMRQQCPLLAQSGHSLRCNAMSAFGSKADIVRGSATGDFARPKISKIFCEASPHAARATVLGDGVRKLGHAKFSHAPAFDNLLMCSSTNGASRSGAWV